MGGTSTDVCLIAGGKAGRERRDARSAAFPVRLPMVDIHTVGAGGGSIAWRDAGGALRVGPRSAGADPGPGLLRPRRHGADGDGRQPSPRPPPRVAARGPRAGCARPPSAALGEIDPAAVVEVVNAEMLRALRVVSVERGPRPAGVRARRLRRSRAAARVRPRRGARRLDRARARGGGGALGARPRRERRTERPRRVGRAPARRGGRAAAPRVRRAFATGANRSSSRSRWATELAERFHRAHEEQYGYADTGREIELVALRTVGGRAGAVVRAHRRRAVPRAAPSSVRRRSSSPARPAGCPRGWAGRQGRARHATCWSGRNERDHDPRRAAGAR